MRLGDIPECARIVASHPTLGPTYGAEIANVCAVWRRLFAIKWYFTSAVFEDTLALDRGKEKRRPLLAYLREHPEELRPISRKPLQTPSAVPDILSNRKLPPRHSSLLRSSRVILK
jgi:hypothetical protein